MTSENESMEHINEIFNNFKKENPSLDKSKKIKKNENISEFCQEKAEEEIEIIRNAFLEFQEKIIGLVITEYISSQLEYFANYAMNLEELILNDINSDKLSIQAKEQYKALQRFKAQIYSSLYNKYKVND